MRIDEFITSLREKNKIRIAAVGGELKVKGPQNELTSDVLSLIKLRKGEILEYLRADRYTIQQIRPA